jgi:N-acyl-phosphatidylethanolamine-hydrolysing phospholipase D
VRNDTHDCTTFDHAMTRMRSRNAHALAALLLAACTSNPYYDPAKPHHARDGFHNRYPHAEKGSFWKWKFEEWREGLPPSLPAGGWHFDVVKPDVPFLRTNRSVETVTWIGHATFLVQLGGLNILADPHLTARASPVSFAGPKRVVPPALGFDDLPHIDVVVVSHNHYDHMDAETLTRLAKQSGGAPRYLVGLGLKRWFVAQGIETVDELDWWDVIEVDGVKFNFVPTQHWSKRTLWDENQTLWGGWLIESPTFRFFHAGDSGYSRDFVDIRSRYGKIDLAALPVGGYAPRWFMQVNHFDPDDAVKAHTDLGTRFTVGMHWGTFADLTDEPLDEVPQRVARAIAHGNVSADRFFLMRHGETRLLDRRYLDTLPMR